MQKLQMRNLQMRNSMNHRLTQLRKNLAKNLVKTRTNRFVSIPNYRTRRNTTLDKYDECQNLMKQCSLPLICKKCIAKNPALSPVSLLSSCSNQSSTDATPFWVVSDPPKLDSVKTQTDKIVRGVFKETRWLIK